MPVNLDLLFTQAALLDLRGYGIKSNYNCLALATEFNGPPAKPEDVWKIQPEDIGQIVVDLLKMHPRTQ